MAEEKEDLFDDITDESESDTGDDMGDEETPETPEAGSEEDNVREAVADLAEMGIILPDHITSGKDLAQHICTAIKTHKATKATMGGGGGEATAESGVTQEESPTLMSTLREHVDPAIAGMAARIESGKRKRDQKRIDRLERAGVLKPGRAANYRKKATGMRLSLVRSGGFVRTDLDEVLDALEDVPHNLSLTRLHIEPNPMDGANDKETDETVDALTTRPPGWQANGNGHGQRKNGKRRAQ